MSKINDETLEEIQEYLSDLDDAINSVNNGDISLEVDFSYRVPDSRGVNQDILDEVDENVVEEWKYELESLRDQAQSLVYALDEAYDAANSLAYALTEAQGQRNSTTEVEVGDTVQTATGSQAFVLAVVFLGSGDQHAWLSATQPEGMGIINSAPFSVASELLEIIETANERKARESLEASRWVQAI